MNPRSLLVLSALLLLLCGCGIRPTTYPVDADQPAERARCESSVPRSQATSTPMPGSASAAPSSSSSSARGHTHSRSIYLVCDDGLMPVQRLVKDHGRDSPAGTATRLLVQLITDPPLQEQAAGYVTAVPSDTAVRPGRDSDPTHSLRLNHDPTGLPAWALGQVVCTLTAGLEWHTVRLGGPGGHRVRAFTCSRALTHEPDAGRADTRSVR